MAGWDADPDPGLSDLGRAQVASVAADLAGSLGPRPILVSPLRRTRETAVPLCATWGLEASIEPAVGEIPSPVPDLAARGAWLDHALHARFAELDDAVRAWREGLLARLRSVTLDTVVVTHFVAINAVVGAALGVDDVTTFLPANTSVTEIEIDPDTGAITVIARGADAPPIVG